MFDTQDLRQRLLDDLNDLRAGRIGRAEARARAILAHAIIETVRVEIAAAAMNVDKIAPIVLTAAGPRVIENREAA